MDHCLDEIRADHGAVEPALRPSGGLSGVGYPLHCLVSVHSDQSPVAPQPLQLCTDAVFGPAACRLSLAGSESGDSDLGDGSLRSRGGDVPISVAGQIQSHWDVLQSQLFRDLRDGHLCGRFRSIVLPGTRRWLPMGKAPVWLTAVVAGLAFVLAQSRGGLLAFVAAVAFIGLSRFGKPFWGILLVGLILGAIVPNPLQQRILAVGTNDPYAFTRQDIWKNSLQRIGDHPWGVGLGIYKYTSFRYRFPIEGSIARFAKRAESAHNDYLQMAVEQGVVGLVMFLVGLGFLGWEIRETLRLGLEPWERGVVIGLSGGILGILTHGAVDAVFHEPAIVLLLCLFAGLILVLREMRTSGSLSVVEVPFAYRPTRAVLIVVLAALLGILVIRPAAAWYAFDEGERELAVGRVDHALDWYQWATYIDPGISSYHDAVAATQVRLYRQSGAVQRLHRAASEP